MNRPTGLHHSVSLQDLPQFAAANILRRITETDTKACVSFENNHDRDNTTQRVRFPEHKLIAHAHGSELRDIPSSKHGTLPTRAIRKFCKRLQLLIIPGSSRLFSLFCSCSPGPLHTIADGTWALTV